MSLGLVLLSNAMIYNFKSGLNLYSKMGLLYVHSSWASLESLKLHHNHRGSLLFGFVNESVVLL